MSDYKDLMHDFYDDSIPPEPMSEEEQQRLLRDVMRKGGAARPEKRISMKKVRLIAALAAAFGVCAIGAAAANHFLLGDNIMNFFSPSAEQRQQIESAAAPIGRAETQDGWTMELVSCFGDRFKTYVQLGLTAPEGVELPDDTTLTNIRIHPQDPGGQAFSYGMSVIDSLGRDEAGRLTLLLAIDAPIGPEALPMTIEIEGLRRYDMEARDYAVVSDAKWRFADVSLAHGDLGTAVETDAQIEIFSGDARVTAIHLSPISLTVEASGESIRNYNTSKPSRPERIPEDLREEFYRALEEGFNFMPDADMPVTVQMKDGTVMEFAETSAAVDGDRMVFSGTFPSLIDPAQIASVTVCGVEIAL